ncbi:MAG: pyruvate kinase, partial [Bacteroidota bacterium]
VDTDTQKLPKQMKIKEGKISLLINQIDQILEALEEKEQSTQKWLAEVHPDYKKSARNLVHYMALRDFDLRSMQKRLGNLGLSRFANAQGHVKASLLNTSFMLRSLISDQSKKNRKPGLSIKNSKRFLVSHTKELLGYRSKGRRVRIMVTQPTQAATDYQLVYDMVKNGMNCARINCAHDNPEVWEQIIKNVKKASKALGRNVKITMDLAGPKIRTGEIVPGPKVRKFTPERDGMGIVIHPALIIFVTELNEESPPNALPVPEAWLNQLQVGDQLLLHDTRGRARHLKVAAHHGDEVWINCYNTSYIGTGTVIHDKSDRLEDVVIGEIPPIEQALILRTNDLLKLHKDLIPGEPAQFDEDGNLLRLAHISCQVPKVFDSVKIGESILFDDGKITGMIEGIQEDHLEVRIMRAKVTGAKLKAEKGINFPTTDLGISGLTAKDKADLAFVARHADVVNFSFVNTRADVEELIYELNKHGVRDKLSIILKIETQRAFDNLAEILLTAMQVKYIGVMIARGDLAVETGWDHIGKVQREILSICSAAHIPVVWATQVLESLAKKGLPSRSEITDATSSLRAECVMLNKGLYINDAIHLLDSILSDMESYQEKSEAMLPQLGKLLK